MIVWDPSEAVQRKESTLSFSKRTWISSYWFRHMLSLFDLIRRVSIWTKDFVEHQERTSKRRCGKKVQNLAMKYHAALSRREAGVLLVLLAVLECWVYFSGYAHCRSSVKLTEGKSTLWLDRLHNGELYRSKGGHCRSKVVSHIASK